MKLLFKQPLGFFISIWLCMMCTDVSWAQSRLSTAEIDSLYAVWNDESASPKERSESIIKLGNGFRRRQPDSVIYYTQHLFQFATTHDLPHYKGKALYNEALAYYDLGKYDRSIALSEKAVEQFFAIDDIKFVGVSTAYMGNTYKVMGELEKAEECFRDAIQYFEASNHTKPIAMMYGSLARIYQNRENYAKAAEYYTSAGKRMKILGYEEGLAVNYGNLGNLYSSQGNSKKAKEAYQKGMHYAEKHDLKRMLGTYYSKLGDFYIAEYEVDSAFHYYRKSLRLTRKIQSKQKIVSSLQKMADGYQTLKVLDSAIYYYDKAYVLSLEIGDRKGEIFTLFGLSSTYYMQGDMIRSASIGRKAHDVIDETGLIGSLDNLDKQLYQTYYALDELDSAAFYLNEMVDVQRKSLSINYSVLNERQKEMFFGTMAFNFEVLNDFVYRSEGQSELVAKAYDNALLLKGMMLRSSSAMRNSILSSGDTILVEKFQKWLSLKESIAENYSGGSSVASLQSQADSLEVMLIKNSDAFSDMRKALNFSWEDIQSNLGKKEVAIEFIRFHHQPDYRKEEVYPVYAALIIDRSSDSPQFVKLCNESDLQAVIGNFPGNNLTYVNQLYGTKDAPGAKVYELVWKPLEKVLEGKKKISYSPEGLLHKIAFSALANERGEMLIDRYDLNLLNSTGNVLKSSIALNTENLHYDLFGGVLYSTDSTEREVWSYLEGTKNEIDEIAELLEEEEMDYTSFSEYEASEENFKSSASTSEVLHISTHGYFYPDPKAIEEKTEVDDELEGDIDFRGADVPSGYSSFVEHPNPLMRSGLALSGANDVWSYDVDPKNDGVLTAREVASLDMRNTNLVVLSACETGLGDIKGYEGVYGLQRSFKVAGADRLMMSLWQVPDKETAEFMKLFYAAFLKKGDVGSAFNTAQRTMRKKYDPYYWAAFVLVE
jgi:CHAT domain-containing protein